MPNLKNDLINDTLSVDLDSTQTLSNKTLTTPTINGPEITATGGTPRIHGIYLPEPHFITFEGSTTDEFETVLTVVNPTADRTVSLPDASGTVALSGTIALGTDTTGNYVATIAGTANQITVTGSGSETAGVTLSLPANVTISNNLTVTGDFTVNGTTTTINTATLNVSDNIIILNNDVTGTPTENAGIEVERGTSPNVAIRWNETTDKWQFTTDGTNYSDLGAGGASVSDTAPTSPASGQIWFESDTGQTFVYYSDGTSSQWVEIGASGTAAFISDSAPSNPVSGQIWFNSSDGGTYVYYADGSSNQWIEVGAQPQTLNIGDTAPASPVNGQLWYNSSDGGTYVYYGSAWVEVGAAPYNTLLNLIDAKGDLFVGSADNTVVKLGVGSDNQFLMANSSAASGLSWSTIEDDQVILAGQIFG